MANDEHDNREMDRRILLDVRRDMAEQLIDNLAVAAEEFMQASNNLIKGYRDKPFEYIDAQDRLRGILMAVAEIPEKM